MQMTDTLKPKSRLPITSARDYDNGQVSVTDGYIFDNVDKLLAVGKEGKILRGIMLCLIIFQCK